jgi:NRAMP (natural resistance-associated macrophage protein)-like metal ion transporter
MSNFTKTILQPLGGRFLRQLGPGLITGASDDDPSGIATYAQVGAQFGYALSWTMLFTYPLMTVIQEISARIGRVTGMGIAGNIKQHCPMWLLRCILFLLLFANIINLGADLGAMGEAGNLIFPGPVHIYTVSFAVLCVVLQIFLSYARYVSVLKWLTLTLFTYFAVAIVIHIPWETVLLATITPSIPGGKDGLVSLVAVLGTTISPYLFFWQSSEESEDEKETPGALPLREAPRQARKQLRRIRIDTMVGMGISNLVGYFIIVITASTLYVSGHRDIQTAADAAEALRPIAGDFAFLIFSLGIIGTGLLAVPVLAGSAAYAIGEAMEQPVGFSQTVKDAKAFYLTIGVATLLGLGINFVHIDPIKALFWSAVINGVTAAPVMALMMWLGARHVVMGEFVLSHTMLIIGWLATGIMLLCGIATVVQLFFQ